MPLAYVYRSFGGPEQEELIDVPKPDPGPGRLLVAVRAAGVNPADWKRRSGRSPGLEALTFPIGLGREAAGVVEAVGPDVTDFAIGDEVFGQVDDSGSGAFAQYALLTAGNAARKPTSVSFRNASTLAIAGATAYDGIGQLALKPGQSVLITGAGGGVGIAAVQIARSCGLRVIGTASDSKRAVLESLGATHVTYGEGEAARIRAVSNDGVDGVFDLVGGSSLRTGAASLTDQAKLVTAADPALARELGGAAVLRARSRAVLERLASMVDGATLDPFVRQVFPLERAGEALRVVEDGHVLGKVVVEPSS